MIHRKERPTISASLPAPQSRAPENIDATFAKLPLSGEGSEYDVLVAGALAADLSCDYAPLEGFADSATPLLHTSNPATFSHSVGGVGHNVALAAHFAGASTILCSAVGDDIAGRTLIHQVAKTGLTISGIQVLDPSSDAQTAQYVAINDTKKDLMVAMADTSILYSPILDSKSVWQQIMVRNRPKWVVIDGNWSSSIISHIAAAANSVGAHIAFEPVSAQKSTRLIKLLKSDNMIPNHVIRLAAPNVLELQTMYQAARAASLFESEAWWTVIDALNLPRGGSRERFIQLTNRHLVDQGVPQQSLQLLPCIPCVVTKLGAQGCLVSQLLGPGDPRLTDPDHAPYILGRGLDGDGVVGGVYMRLIPAAEPIKPKDVVSVNGAGDTLLGVLIAGLAKRGANARVEDLLKVAQQAAVKSLKSSKAVSEEIKGIWSIAVA